MKWVPVTKSYELNDSAIVTMLGRGAEPYVRIGLAGYGIQNGTIAYMPLPESINENPAIWKSEYRGDDLPIKDDWYLVQLQGVALGRYNYGRLKIDRLYFLSKKSMWLAVPDGWEVIAWMELPKPYNRKRLIEYIRELQYRELVIKM